MSLYEKMYNVMCEVEGIEKNMTVGSGPNSYNAVSEKEVLNKIKPLFAKYKLIIFPIGGTINESVTPYIKSDKYKKDVEEKTIRAITSLIANYRIIDIESKEYVDIVGFGNGADSQDKGAGKAFTYSFKSAICKTFMMFSGDDTDNTHSDDVDKTDKKTDAAKEEETLVEDTRASIINGVKVTALISLAKSKGMTEKQLDVACQKNFKQDLKNITEQDNLKLLGVLNGLKDKEPKTLL